MEKKPRTWTKWLYWFTFAVAVIFVYKIFDNFGEITDWIGTLFQVLAPFFIGLLIAYILYLPCRKVEEFYKKTKNKWIRKKARTFSVVTVYLITLLLIILLFTWIIPPIIDSVIDLANNFQTYYDMAISAINNLPEDNFFKTDIMTGIMNAIQNIDIKEILNVEALTQYLQGAVSFANGIVNTFVAIIVSIYLLISRRNIIQFFKKLAGVTFKPQVYRNMDKYFNRSNQIFFKFLAGQFIDAIVVGILTSIAMSIMGVKYAPLLGFMIGLFNMIPYIGAIIAVIIAGIITFFTGGIEQTIWMLIVVIILQQVDANIINPKIVGNSLKINPLLVIFAVTVGGAYFGMLGIFLSVPISAIIKVSLDEYIDYRSRKIKALNNRDVP